MVLIYSNSLRLVFLYPAAFCSTRNGVPSCFSSAEWFGTEFRQFVSTFVPWNGIPSCFFFRGRVPSQILRVCFHFLFHGTEFQVFFYSAEGFRTGFREISVLRNSRNSIGNDICSIYSVFFCRKFPTLVITTCYWCFHRFWCPYCCWCTLLFQFSLVLLSVNLEVCSYSVVFSLKSLIQLDSLMLLSSLQLLRSTCVSNIPGVLPVVGFFIIVGIPAFVSVFIYSMISYNFVTFISLCFNMQLWFFKFLIFVASFPNCSSKGPRNIIVEMESDRDRQTIPKCFRA